MSVVGCLICYFVLLFSVLHAGVHPSYTTFLILKHIFDATWVNLIFQEPSAFNLVFLSCICLARCTVVIFLETGQMDRGYDSGKVELQHAIRMFEPGSEILALVKLEEIVLRLMLWKYPYITGCEVFILF
jgi:hypothetical protein